jgi:hypothetical protein
MIDPEDALSIAYADIQSARRVAREEREKTASSRARKKRPSKKSTSSKSSDIDQPKTDGHPTKPGIKWEDNGTSGAMVELGNLTLDQVTMLIGQYDQAEEWLKSVKLKEDIRAARLKNEATEGSTISRELVETRVLGVVDEAFRRLLTDGAKTLASQVFAMAKSGQTVQEAEREISATIGKVLELAKTKPQRALKRGR